MQSQPRLLRAPRTDPLAPLRRAWREARVAGVDEAGRGCLAGPVVAAAVILPWPVRLPGLTDSKRLPAHARERLYTSIESRALAVAIGIAQPEEIDRVNVLQATYLAMRRAVAALPISPTLVTVDGYPIHDLGLEQVALVDGDARFPPISAASIMAKVWRDRLMLRYEQQYPGYGFAGHKGYGTREHLEALRALGPCDIHRLSFEPVAALRRPRLQTDTQEAPG